MKTSLNIILIALLPILWSCSVESEEKFTYTIQQAGYDYKKYDQMGSIDLPKFKEVFGSIDWQDEAAKCIKIGTGCSTTVSVTDQLSGTELWVSVAGDPPREPTYFLIGYIYEKDKKPILGVGKSKRIRWMEIYAAFDASPVYENFDYFFSRKPEELLKSLRKLDLFAEMEPQN